MIIALIMINKSLLKCNVINVMQCFKFFQIFDPLSLNSIKTCFMICAELLVIWHYLIFAYVKKKYFK